jgi:uncharacterized protein (DUF488 family)
MNQTFDNKNNSNNNNTQLNKFVYMHQGISEIEDKKRMDLKTVKSKINVYIYYHTVVHKLIRRHSPILIFQIMTVGKVAHNTQP